MQLKHEASLDFSTNRLNDFFLWCNFVTILLDLWIEEKHPESRSSSQQVIFDTEGTSSSESSLLGTVRNEFIYSIILSHCPN